jgi:hypothetical protein
VPFVLKNHRTVLNKRSGSVTFWAWTVSILLHLLVLTVLGFVRLSKSQSKIPQKHLPTAKVSQLKSLMESATVVPKPKIKRPSRNIYANRRGEILKKSSFLVPHSTISNSSVSQKTVDTPNYSLAKSDLLLPEVEFFGNSTYDRKICYLVDCSGSMQGMMGQVLQQLKDSIENLPPDYYFYVIFFGDGKLYELGNGKLIRASQRNKEAAYVCINRVQASGRTNAFTALERAVQIEDSLSNKASVFYFLTDGFELTYDDGESFCRKTAELIKRYAPNSKINTIGFWPTDQDCSILRAMASLSGGECVLITDNDF